MANITDEKYEMPGSHLCRRIYGAVNDELRLKRCVPNVVCGQVEVPGVGLRPITLRDKIIYEYHHGALVGHCGRDRTLEMIERLLVGSDVCRRYGIYQTLRPVSGDAR